MPHRLLQPGEVFRGTHDAQELDGFRWLQSRSRFSAKRGQLRESAPGRGAQGVFADALVSMAEELFPVRCVPSAAHPATGLREQPRDLVALLVQWCAKFGLHGQAMEGQNVQRCGGSEIPLGFPKQCPQVRFKVPGICETQTPPCALANLRGFMANRGTVCSDVPGLAAFRFGQQEADDTRNFAIVFQCSRSKANCLVPGNTEGVEVGFTTTEQAVTNSALRKPNRTKRRSVSVWVAFGICS